MMIFEDMDFDVFIGPLGGVNPEMLKILKSYLKMIFF